MKKIIAIICAVLTVGTSTACIGKNEKTKETNQTETKPVIVETCEYTMSAEEWAAVQQVVMTEAGGECYEGQKAVAQCILNTCRITGKRPIAVIEQYSYAWKVQVVSDSVKRACIDVFKYGKCVLDSRVTMFYSPANMKDGFSRIHEGEIYFTTIGGHKFFIERRYEKCRL